VIALDHARRFPDRVRGVTFLEGHIHPIARWEDMDEGSRHLFPKLRTPGVGEQMIIDDNFFCGTGCGVVGVPSDLSRMPHARHRRLHAHHRHAAEPDGQCATVYLSATTLGC
jgi:hypothetical protein